MQLLATKNSNDSSNEIIIESDSTIIITLTPLRPLNPELLPNHQISHHHKEPKNPTNTIIRRIMNVCIDSFECTSVVNLLFSLLLLLSTVTSYNNSQQKQYTTVRLLMLLLLMQL